MVECTSYITYKYSIHWKFLFTIFYHTKTNIVHKYFLLLNKVNNIYVLCSYVRFFYKTENSITTENSCIHVSKINFKKVELLLFINHQNK